MQEKTLLKLSLVVSLTGLLLLIIILEQIEIKEYKIKDLTNELIGKDVQLKGTITRITETPGLIIFNMNDKTGEIAGIIFKDEQQINITKDQDVEITGKIQLYKSKLEIEVNELKSIN